MIPERVKRLIDFVMKERELTSLCLYFSGSLTQSLKMVLQPEVGIIAKKTALRLNDREYSHDTCFLMSFDTEDSYYGVDDF